MSQLARRVFRSIALPGIGALLVANGVACRGDDAPPFSQGSQGPPPGVIAMPVGSAVVATATAPPSAPPADSTVTAATATATATTTTTTTTTTTATPTPTPTPTTPIRRPPLGIVRFPGVAPRPDPLAPGFAPSQAVLAAASPALSRPVRRARRGVDPTTHLFAGVGVRRKLV